jgi:hypothetical protein
LSRAFFGDLDLDLSLARGDRDRDLLMDLDFDLSRLCEDLDLELLAVDLDDLRFDDIVCDNFLSSLSFSSAKTFFAAALTPLG